MHNGVHTICYRNAQDRNAKKCSAEQIWVWISRARCESARAALNTKKCLTLHEKFYLSRPYVEVLSTFCVRLVMTLQILKICRLIRNQKCDYQNMVKLKDSRFMFPFLIDIIQNSVSTDNNFKTHFQIWGGEMPSYKDTWFHIVQDKSLSNHCPE